MWFDWFLQVLVAIRNNHKAFLDYVKKHGDTDETATNMKSKSGLLTTEDLQKSWELSLAQKGNYIAGRLGMLIDGSGRNLSGVKAQIREFVNEFGYDFLIVFVNVTLETSMARAQKRELEQEERFGVGRKVPEDVAKTSHAQIQGNIPELKRLFGDKFIYIDNDTKPDKAVLDAARKKVRSFLAAPPKHLKAIAWITDQKGGDSKMKEVDKAQAVEDRKATSAARKAQFVKDDTASK